jgi:peptidyl-prolyl cis-trans isomerase SurA
MCRVTSICVKKSSPVQAGSVIMTKLPLPIFTAFICTLVLGATVAQAQGLRASPGLSAGRSPQDNTQRTADYIVAVVNSEPITNNEVRSRLLRIEQQMSQRGGALPSREELATQVLERLISERAQVQLARDNGIKIEEAALDAAVGNVARQNQLTIEELRKSLEADGIAYSQFRNGLRDEMLLTRVREREVEGRVTISEQELDRYISEQQDTPDASAPEINLAQILIALPESASEAQIQALQTRATRAAQRAKAGNDFAALVREYSESNDSATGGVMGLRNADRYPPLFVEATQNLRVGEVTGVVRSGAGFHVLKLLEKKLASALGFTTIQSRARHILLRPSAQLSQSAARERLTELRRRIMSKEIDFATAARDNSQDGSAKEGGDLGWANPGQFVPEFEEVMNSLAPGDVSPPLVSRFGVHLIELQARRQNTLSVREQRELARNALREKKAEEAFVIWAQDVRGRAYVEMREPPAFSR